MSGPLGQVQVIDARTAAGSGWVASVTFTGFTGPGAVIAASAVGYTAGMITHSVL